MTSFDAKRQARRGVLPRRALVWKSWRTAMLAIGRRLGEVLELWTADGVVSIQMVHGAENEGGI